MTVFGYNVTLILGSVIDKRGQKIVPKPLLSDDVPLH